MTPLDRSNKKAKTLYQETKSPRLEGKLGWEAEGIGRKMCFYEGKGASNMKDDHVFYSVEMKTCQSAANVLGEEEMKVLKEKVKEMKIWREAMQDNNMLGSIVGGWIRSEGGKLLNNALVSKVNARYEKLVDKGAPCRKCKANNLYREIKSLLKVMRCGKNEEYDGYMQALEEEIEKQTSLPGGEFVDMLCIYLHTNMHIDLDREKLIEATGKARKGEFKFKDRKLKQWVLNMIRQLSRTRGFGDLGISDTDIASGLEFDAV